MSSPKTQYLDNLILRELESLRISASDDDGKDLIDAEPMSTPQPWAAPHIQSATQPSDMTNPPSDKADVELGAEGVGMSGTEVKPISSPQPPTAGQGQTAIRLLDGSGSPCHKADEGGKAPVPRRQAISDLIDAEEAANGFMGKPVALIHLRDTTKTDKKRNGDRLQRVYRLAQKLEVLPGTRWIRDGKPYLQPAVPRVVGHADGTMECNQFLLDGEGKVALRMPGGWRRDLVRNRREFLGVALIDGYLWPRFHHSLPHRTMSGWEEQGFVELNEVIYNTPFKPREALKPAPKEDEKDDVLIDFS
ncbi:hypothetical protein diail_4723 [Diaporthe ilicicola]|nr:hypothetical protein diail_4723 [Diaporthe ilicicola]